MKRYEELIDVGNVGRVLAVVWVGVGKLELFDVEDAVFRRPENNDVTEDDVGALGGDVATVCGTEDVLDLEKKLKGLRRVVGGGTDVVFSGTDDAGDPDHDIFDELRFGNAGVCLEPFVWLDDAVDERDLVDISGVLSIVSPSFRDSFDILRGNEVNC